MDEHIYPGAQLFLTGSSLARSMIWDGMRAIDYLLYRPEVDPTRIGATGRSGGGTQSAYVAAMDERVHAAAPENYITSLQRLWETRGPQDPEQHFVKGVARGLDHADLLIARAPRPTLIVTTTRDIFSIQGARETYAEATRAFSALGAPDHLQIVEDDAGHESTRANREATYAFFQDALSLPGDPGEEEVELLPDDLLRVTPAGRELGTLYPETTFSLNSKAASELKESRLDAAQTDPEYPTSAIRKAKEISGYREPADVGEPVFMGRYRREGYSVGKYMLSSAGGYPIPFLMMLPNGRGPHPAVVYLHPDGKAEQAAPGGEMERLVREGFAVIAPDLAGYGEMAPRDLRSGADDPRTQLLLWFGSVSVGRSLTGILASDLVRLVRAALLRPEIEDGGIRGIGRGETASVLLHAAAFEPLISSVALVSPLVSYSNLVATPYYEHRFIPGGVAGMLTAYDLTDLAASLAPRPVLMLNPVDGAAARIDAEAGVEELKPAREVYSRMGDADQLQVVSTDSDARLHSTLADWLQTQRRNAP